MKLDIIWNGDIMNNEEDFGYSLAHNMFSKMTNEGLYQLKMMLESDVKVDTGGEKQADEDILNDLNRYISENKIEL